LPGRALVAGSILVGAAALFDLLTAGVLAVACGCLAVLLRSRRSHARLRAALALGLVGATLCGVFAAVAVGLYRQEVDPLVLARTATGCTGSPRCSATLARAPAPVGFEALGFLANDDDDALNAVDENVTALTTMAVTGFRLDRSPGGLLSEPVDDSLQRARMAGTQALMTVSNYGADDFDGLRAQRMLTDPGARARLVSALAEKVAQGWDGVVLDLELLPAAVRADYPVLVRQLRAALPRGSRVLVALPAFTSTDEDAAAFDVPALTAAADAVVLMAYDDHETSMRAGDIGGLPWVRRVVEQVSSQVGAAALRKFLLGVPSYGYLWPARGKPSELTVRQARELAGKPGAVNRWDPVQAEWHLSLPDGSQAWYDDRRSVAARVDLARRLGFGGVGVWRLGGGDPLDGAQLGPVHKYPPRPPAGRPVEQVPDGGLVALTFDDGPDPAWTPRVLDELAALHVPATFFVIGEQAAAHPGLVRREVRDGHVVGNHTYSHKRLSTLPRWRAEAEVLGGAAVVESVIGRKPLLFRAPYGATDAVSGAGRSEDSLALSLGFEPVSWTVDPLDWTRPGTQAISDAVLAGRSARTVVLLHDGGGNREQTVAALPGLVKRLRALGFRFTTVDQLDAAVPAAYAERSDWRSKARSVAIIATIRLDWVAHRLLRFSLLFVELVAGWRLVVAVPLALLDQRRRRRRAPDPVGPRSTVSVLVAAHNEEDVLDRCLHSLRDLGPDVEVIVIDDGSTDATVELARAHPVRVISQTRKGKAAALNAGLALAGGEVVVVVDADTQLDPGFLDTVCAHFTDPAVGAVAANVKVGNREQFLSRLQALEYVVSLNLDRRAQNMMRSIPVVPGAAGAFRTAALRSVGGYPDRTLVEDADLTMTLLRDGWRIQYEPAATARTEAPQQAADVLKQRRRWAFGTVQVAAAHRKAILRRRAGRAGWLALPWLVVSQIVSPVLGPVVDVYLAALALTGHLTQAAVMLGLALGVDVLTCALAVHLDREDWRLLGCSPALRLVWRPLQLWATLQACHAWLAGDSMRWRRVTRHNSVLAVATPIPAAEHRMAN
jgi:peptidoglycan/xylan/chitin deacetylase (PgdA/CDA1 family)